MTTYVFAFDDGPPSAELDCLDEENGVPFGSLDCTALVTHDGLQGWTWSDSDQAHREVPHEAAFAERGASREEISALGERQNSHRMNTGLTRIGATGKIRT